MTSSVSSKNNEKRPKGKKVLKKRETKQKKKNGTLKKLKKTLPGVEPGLFAFVLFCVCSVCYEP